MTVFKMNIIVTLNLAFVRSLHNNYFDHAISNECDSELFIQG